MAGTSCIEYCTSTPHEASRDLGRQQVPLDDLTGQCIERDNEQRGIIGRRFTLAIYESELLAVAHSWNLPKQRRPPLTGRLRVKTPCPLQGRPTLLLLGRQGAWEKKERQGFQREGRGDLLCTVSSALDARLKTMAAPWNPSACSPAVKTAALHLLPCLVKKGSDGGGDPLAGRPRRDGEEARERIGGNAARVSSVGFPIYTPR
jgi:hypothetical protein